MPGITPIGVELADRISNSLQGILCQDNNLLQRLAGILIYPEEVTDPAIRPALELLAPRSCRPRGGQTLPVQGGQCANVLYRVPFQRIAPDGTILASEFQNVVGPITGLSPRWQADFFGNQAYFVRILCPNDQEQGGVREFGPSSYTDNSFVSRTVLGAITRMDNQPDTCGNGPLLPPAQPQPWPPFQLPQIDIDIGGINVPFNVTVNINPIINLPDFGGFHMPVNINIAPNIVVPAGLPTIIYFRFPELEVNFGPSFNWDITTITNTGGIQRPCPPSPDECDCVDIREIVREELDEKFPPARPFFNRITVASSANSGQVVLPPFTYRVDFQLNDIPVNAKVQSGGGAPDVYYAGWYCFGSGANQGDRNPISYERNTFYPPDGVQNFTYTLQQGYTGTVTVYWREEV